MKIMKKDNGCIRNLHITKIILEKEAQEMTSFFCVINWSSSKETLSTFNIGWGRMKALINEIITIKNDR